MEQRQFAFSLSTSVIQRSSRHFWNPTAEALFHQSLVWCVSLVVGSHRGGLLCKTQLTADRCITTKTSCIG